MAVADAQVVFAHFGVNIGEIRAHDSLYEYFDGFQAFDRGICDRRIAAKYEIHLLDTGYLFDSFVAEREDLPSDVRSVAGVCVGFRSDLGFADDMMPCCIGNQYKILEGIIAQSSNTW